MLLGDGLKASLLSEYVRLRKDHDDLAAFKHALSDRLTEEYVFAAETFAKSSYDKICGEFYDNRGTRCDDYEFLQVKINVTAK